VKDGGGHNTKVKCIDDRPTENNVWCSDTVQSSCQSTCPGFCARGRDLKPHQINLNEQCPSSDVRQWSRQYLEIDLCNTGELEADEVCEDRQVSGFGVQGDPSTPSMFVANYVVSYQTTAEAASQPPQWTFYTTNNTGVPLVYTSISDGSKMLGQAANLTGATEQQHYVGKVSVVPFNARKVRLHPIAWSGPSMALRAEVYSCLVEFSWDAIKTYVESKALTEFVCDSAMLAGKPAFQKWSEGRGGSGTIFETRKKLLTFSSGETRAFTALQRRKIQGAGLLYKALLCHEKTVDSDDLDQQCCVSKKSKPLAEVWDDQARETLMA